jgi:hypothetical protein
MHYKVKEAYWTETDGAIHVINQKQHGNQDSETAMQLCKQQFSNAMRLHSSKHTGKKSWSYIILQVNCKAYDNAVVISSHDPNVIFSLANKRTSGIVFY